jgi:hypothetical protein
VVRSTQQVHATQSKFTFCYLTKFRLLILAYFKGKKRNNFLKFSKIHESIQSIKFNT